MRNRRMSLCQLVVTAALFSLVLSAGFPLLFSYMQFLRLHQASQTMTSAMIAARMSAVKQYRPVVLCSSHDGEHCDQRGTWEEGFLYFVDTDLNGRRNDGETVVQSFPSMDSGTTIRSIHPDAHQIVYLPSGRVRSAEIFNICVNSLASKGRSIELSISGRPDSHPGAVQCPTANDGEQSLHLAQR